MRRDARVLVAVDQSPGAESAFHFALSLLSRNATIYALHVRDPNTEAAWMYEAEQRNSAGQALVWEYEVEARAEDLLARFRGMAHAAGITCHAVSRKAGDARAELCEAVERQAIELLVVGSRGLGAVSRDGGGATGHRAARGGLPRAGRRVQGAEWQTIELLLVGSGGLGPCQGTHSEGAGVARSEAEHGGRGEPRYKGSAWSVQGGHKAHGTSKEGEEAGEEEQSFRALEKTRKKAHGASKEGEEAGEEEQSGRVMREGGEGEEGVEEKREAIREAMAHAWKGYRQYAWGMDELQPRTKTGANHFGGLGLTIVDSLDSLYLMGLTKEFNEAKSWVQEKLFFEHDYDANVFETTIRILGGLLSAYDLSGDPMLLAKARELADKLLPAFATPTGIPLAFVNLASGTARSHGWTGRSAVLADLGSTQLEMVALSQRTGDPKYANASEHIIRQIAKIFPSDGLLPVLIGTVTGKPTSRHITLGSMGDSFYEYLLKVWVQGGGTPYVQRYRDMWEKSMQGMMDKLIHHSPAPNTTTATTTASATNNSSTSSTSDRSSSSSAGITTSGGGSNDSSSSSGSSGGRVAYVAEMHAGKVEHKMEHVTCFVAGLLVLGAQTVAEGSEHTEAYMKLAKELGHTCHLFYSTSPTGLSGEDYAFGEKGMRMEGRKYNNLRPEAVEAWMYLWRATHDPIYRQWGWEAFQAIQKHCRVENGYVGLLDASQNPPQQDDLQQSFFLAETLKYLYLLFSPDDVLPLNQWVFNTEAHPLKIIARNADSPPQVRIESQTKRDVLPDDD
ncbi:unnamed protein product [Closterium sp. Naga37s-1]|nr:unnamed protein product [Closterium sp. Naga37s-1]